MRLTDERWAHIVEEHSEMGGLRYEVMDTIANPAVIVAGNYGVLMASRELTPGKFLVAVYREKAEDGFVITSFITSRRRYITRRKRVWPD